MKRTFLLAFILSLLLAALHQKSSAQLTALDSSFSDDGILELDSVKISSLGKTYTVIQPDGKILTAGTYAFFATPTSHVMGCLLMRFHSDGKPDSSFAMNGVKMLPSIDNGNTIGLALMPDGRIVTATATSKFQGNSYILHRLLSDGSPDPSFNDSGKVVFQRPPGAGIVYYNALCLESNGKIVLTGQWWDQNLFHYLNVFRHNANGSPDSTYGYLGRSSNYLFDTYKIMGNVMAHQADEKLIVVGSAQDTPLSFNRNRLLVARCLPDGSLDTSFNGGLGYFKHSFAGERASDAHSVVIRPNGKILLSTLSQRRYEGPGIYAVVQLDPNGQRDASFGNNGIVEIDSMAYDVAWDAPPQLTLQPDGKVLVSFTAGMDTASRKFAVHRLHVNGSTDVQFGAGGKVSTRVSRFIEQASSLAIQPDGKIVVAGTNAHLTSGYTTLGLVRFHPNVTLPFTSISFASPVSPFSVYPNPVRETMQVSYSLTKTATVRIALVDVTGRLVQSLMNEQRSVGGNTETLKLAPSLPAGNYFIRFSDGIRTAQSMIVKL